MNYDAHLKGKLHAKRLRLNSASRTQNSVPKINAGMECAPGSVQTAVEEAQTPELVCALNIVDLTPEDIAQANSSPPIKTPIPKGQPKSSGESNSHAGPREQS